MKLASGGGSIKSREERSRQTLHCIQQISSLNQHFMSESKAMENFSVPGGNTRIGPLSINCFESTADFFVYIALISLASEPILSITSWYAKVLHAKALLNFSGPWKNSIKLWQHLKLLFNN
jgi:hypothetical protein